MNRIMSARFWFLLAGVFFFFSWLIPVRYAPWAGAYQELCAYIGLLFLAVSMGFSQVKINVAILLIFSLSTIPAIQLWSGVIFFSGDALTASIYIFCFAWMVLAGFNLGGQQQQKEFLLSLFAFLFVGAASISAWAAFHQLFSLPVNGWFLPLPKGWRPYGNLSQPNNLATLLCWGIAGLIYLYEKKFFGPLGAGVLALFLITGVAVTQSRTPWLGALLAVGYWVWHSRFAIRARLSSGFFVLWVAVYFSISLFALPWLSNFLDLSVVDVTTRASSLQRLEIWGQCLYAVESGPWYGFGWTQVSVAQISVASSYPVPIMIQYCHNVFLDILVWNGPVIGVVVIVLLCGWLLKLNFFKRRLSGDGFCGLVLLFFAVHSLLEYPHAYSFFLLPVGFFIGVLASRESSDRIWGLPRAFLFVFIALGLLISNRFWVEYRIVQEDARLLRFESARVGDLRGGDNLPQVFIFSQLRELLKFARLPVEQGLEQDEVRLVEQVAYRYSNVGSLIKYAEILVWNKQAHQGCEQLLLIKHIYGLDKYLWARNQVLSRMADYPLISKGLLTTRCYDLSSTF